MQASSFRETLPLDSLPGVERLLAHGPPMRLIDSVVEAHTKGVTCRAKIAEDFVFLRDGEAESVVSVELVAQAIGCFVGLSDFRDGHPPRKGLLVGVREASFSEKKLRVGDELVVTAEEQWIRESAASFSGEVRRGDELLARVVLLVVSGIDPASLDGGGVDG
jgi:predicted hotdog family 3-hydroxylacyl-ACP dehydratase